ncbi:LysR family transcriptional regulator [Sphingomonas antarctica]|uniref:LysR family transcriptional regulator n=1 Tax=Sphingomonas antarctica TaxID=2040274 RepID=UPI0039E894FA
MSKDIEVRQCRVLAAVERAGGVAAAARDLGIAQSTVSETLASLERVVGAALTLRRSGREAALTPAAIALMPHAHALIAASEAAGAALSGQSAGVIRLGTVESISSFLLPEPLGAFRQRWPRVDVQVSIGLCENMRQRIQRFELDAAITLETIEPGQGRNREMTQLLSPAELDLVVAPGHPLANGVASREVLREHGILLGDSAGNFSDLLRKWLGDGSGTGPEIRSAGSIEGVKRGVLGGDAVGVVASYAVREELRAGTLRQITPKDPMPPIALFLTTSHPPPWLLPLQNLFDEITTAATSANSPRRGQSIRHAKGAN